MNRKEFESLQRGELLRGGKSLELVMFMGTNSHGGYHLLPIAITGNNYIFEKDGAISFDGNHFEFLRRLSKLAILGMVDDVLY